MFSKIVLVFFLALTCLSSCKQEKVKPTPSNFQEIPIPDYNNDVWRQLNYSDYEIYVENNGGLLIIKPLKHMVEKDTCRMAVPNGLLIGVNHGEWGGSLNFVPTNLKSSTSKILDGNIHSIFYFQNKIYCTEGLAHMHNSHGGLYMIESTKGKYRSHLVVDLEDSPEVISVCPDKLIIATFENLYIVRNSQKQVILSKTFWNSLYPNSIAYLGDQNVFIGMRGGYAKVDLTNKSLKFFKYTK